MNTKINLTHFENFPELESERLLFRKLTISDSQVIFQIRSNDEVMRFMDSAVMKNITEAEHFILTVENSYINKEGINWAIIEKTSNEFLGYFGFWRIIQQHCRAEIGYALKPEYTGKGFMTETMKKMIDFGFNELLLHSIEANVNPHNIKSIKLLEKFGFIKEAYFRENLLFDNKYMDSVIYSLIESKLS